MSNIRLTQLSIDWNALQPQLVKHLQELKAARMEQRRITKIVHHWQAYKVQFLLWKKKQSRHPYLLPSPVDLAFYEPFKSVIFTPCGEENVEFSNDDFDHVDEEWNKTRNEVIVPMLPEEYSTEIDVYGRSQLPLLAVLMFRIIKRRPDGDVRLCYTIGDIFQHPVFIFSEDPPECSPPSKDLTTIALISKYTGIWPWLEDGCGGRPWLWDHKRVHFYPEAHELMKDMLTLLELSPRTTTILQMWKREERFECRLCTSKEEDWISSVSNMPLSDAESISKNLCQIDHQLRYHSMSINMGLTADKRWRVTKTTS